MKSRVVGMIDSSYSSCCSTCGWGKKLDNGTTWICNKLRYKKNSIFRVDTNCWISKEEAEEQKLEQRISNKDW